MMPYVPLFVARGTPVRGLLADGTTGASPARAHNEQLPLTASICQASSKLFARRSAPLVDAGGMAGQPDAAETVLDLTNAHLSSLADIGLPSHLQVRCPIPCMRIVCNVSSAMCSSSQPCRQVACVLLCRSWT